VDAPNLAFTVREAGAFRIDVAEDGESTRVTVIRGSGDVSAGGQSYPIKAGERGDFTGSQDVSYSVSPAPGPDGFDSWAQSRDDKEDNSTSAKYVSRETVGYSDLDDNGTWDEVPEYGHVWYPRTVEVGWAPYSSGYWSSVGPWGWTWVDYEPWGYAPFHYGRWAYIGNRWGWCPGSYYERPYWGPAFVGFYGGGGWGAGFGFGFGGGVGWFPLGYGESFRPWYRHSYGYERNINFRNTRINNFNGRGNYNYAYAHNARAVSVMSHNDFVNGGRVNRGAFHMTDASLRGAQVSSNNRVDGSPTRQSYFGAGHNSGRVATPSAAVQNRSVVARNNPAPGASHMPTRPFNSGTMRPATERPGNGGARGVENSGNRGQSSMPTSSGRFNNSPMNGGATSPRQRELSLDKPNSNMRTNAEGNANRGNANSNSPRGNAGTNGGTNPRTTGRTWDAQGNSSDRGHAPAGYGGNSNRPANNGNAGPATRGTSMTHGDRPPWAGTGNAPRGTMDRGNSPRNSGNYDRGNLPSNNGNVNRGGNNPRSYEPPQRNNSQRPPANYNPGNQSRGNSQPRSYSPPEPRSYSSPRSYSAPSRSYPAPSRNYSAPSGRSYSAPPSRGSYSAPSHSYSAPQSRGGGNYSAPSHSYSAPQSRGGGSYSAPSHSSGGGGSSHGGGGGGGSSHTRH
jgi:hypothetical protein